MSLSTYYLEDGRHLARLHGHHRRCCAYAPMNNTASHDPLAMITTKKSIHGFPLVSYMGIRLRLVALWAARAPL